MSETKQRLSLPVPVIQPRVVDGARYQEAINLDLPPLTARIIASRAFNPEIALKTWLKPGLQSLDSPQAMADLPKATQRLIQAIENKEVIGLETDHDCDGQTSHAVLYLALTEYFHHPKEKVRSFIGHRMQEGYGLSEPLMQRILNDSPRPSLVITADNGSSDEPRIKKLLEAGIDVIVSDHHAIPQEGVPKSAFAVLNPTRDDCGYPDPLVAGCMVAWLFMAYTRSELIKQAKLPANAPSLAQLLDFVAVGTIADCVSLSRSINNRVVTRYGMHLLSQFKRPCWRAIRDEVSKTVSSEDIGFRIAPLLNSDGRLETAFNSVSFLLSDTDGEALNWVKQLIETNKARKVIQNKITKDATQGACEINTLHKKSICVFLEDGHAGVHGISASRIREAFGKPTFLFSPKANDDSLISGSGRSTDDCHLRHALQYMADNHSDLLDKFGGHQGAAGVTIKKENFDAFANAFEQAVNEQIKEDLHPIILTDGPIDDFGIHVDEFIQIQRTLEPFGREFDAPVFELEGQLINLTWMGADKTHARFQVLSQGQYYACVWFNAREDESQEVHVASMMQVRIVFTLQVDTYRYPASLKCFVQHIESI
jgi:single-stranded-DNA-specific exonuclease